MGVPMCDLVFKQTISSKLAEIRARVDEPTNNLIEMIFDTFSTDMIEQTKKFFRDTTNIPVEINFPRRAISLPWIGVINPSEREDERRRVIGDDEGVEGNGSQYWERKGIGISRTTQIWISTQDPQSTLVLYWVVWMILFVNRNLLDEYHQIQDLQLSGGDMKWEQEFLPSYAYSKMISIQHSARLFYLTKPSAPLRVALSLQAETSQVDSTGDLVQTTVPIPPEET